MTLSIEMRELMDRSYPDREPFGSPFSMIQGLDKINCHVEEAHEVKVFEDNDVKAVMFPASFKCNVTRNKKIVHDVSGIGKFDVDDNFSITESKSGKSATVEMKTRGVVGECSNVGKRAVPSVLVCRVF